MHARIIRACQDDDALAYAYVRIRVCVCVLEGIETKQSNRARVDFTDCRSYDLGRGHRERRRNPVGKPLLLAN